MGTHAFILVFSTSHAIRIEKLLGIQGIGCKLIPVPRHLGSDCGVCVRIAQAEMDSARAILHESKIEIQGIAPETSVP